MTMHVGEMQVRRNLGDVVHVGVHDLEAEGVLEPGSDRRDVERQQYSGVMPSAVPSHPITTPCVMNTATTEPGLRPSVRRIAMSLRLSVTTITSVATMLNAATATISSRISVIMVFSMRMARK